MATLADVQTRTFREKRSIVGVLTPAHQVGREASYSACSQCTWNRRVWHK